MDLLRQRNPHARDERIVFDEKPHVYYVDGIACQISVTGLVHAYFPKFDADVVIRKMMHSKNWKNSRYHGMTSEEIKTRWADAGNEAALRGTRMHKSIEAFYNEESTATYQGGVEFETFQNFHMDHKESMEPYRTEWEVYDEDLGIAGSIDMVFRDKSDGTLSIYDWKRSKEMKMSNPYPEDGKGFSHLAAYDNCNFVQYSLQLNVYKYILETRYGKPIRDLYLVAIHPDFVGYRKYKCLDMQHVVATIFESRKKKLV